MSFMSTHSISELVDKNLYSFYDPEISESEFADNTDDLIDLSNKTDQIGSKTIEAIFLAQDTTSETASATVKRFNNNTETLAEIKPLLIGIFYALIAIVGIILFIAFVI